MSIRNHIHLGFAFSVLIVLTASSLMAKDGDPDPTFGGGTMLMAYSSSNDHCYAAAGQSDGKIVMAGFTCANGPNEVLLVRRNSDGSLDTSFGTNGIVTTSVNGTNDQASGVAIQSDGKIVIAGQTGSAGDKDSLLIRYNTNGSFDTSFSGDGIVVTDFGTGDNASFAIAIQTNGRIVAAGWNNDGAMDFAVARYNADGSLDNTFSGDGMVTTDFGVGNDIGRAVAVQADGKIVVGGSVNNGANNDFGLARYDTDGSLDNTFSGDGKVTTAFGADHDDVFGVTIQTNGMIVAVGRTKDGSWYEGAVARYDTDGTLDAGFDGDGKVIISFAAKHDEFRGLTIQPDGKIVLVGDTYYTTHWDLLAVRLNQDGSLDSTFDGDGVAYASVVGDSQDYGRVALLDNAGNVLVAGDCTIDGVYNVAVARFTSDGGIDGTFWPGRAIAEAGGDNNELRGIVLQTDGKAVIGGRTLNGNWDFAVVRYDTNGVLDTTFDGDGIVVTDVGGNHDSCYDMAVQTDGQILAGGRAYVAPSWDFAVVRYNTDGSLDNTFSGDGKVITDITGAHDICNGMALQTDGKIVLVGNSLVGAKYDFAVTRYDTNGTLDASFSGDGMVLTDIDGDNDYGRAVGIQSDGKIVVSGWTDDGVRADFVVVRYNTDGTLDTDFDGDGIVVTSVGGINAKAYDMAIQSDGKIVLAGATDVGGIEDFAAVRYNSDGTLDTNFSGDGMVTTDFGDDDSCATLVLQSENRMVLAGNTHDGQHSRFALLRYVSCGELDGRFGEDGKVITTVCENDMIFGSAVRDSGDILVSGRTYTGIRNIFATVSYLGATPAQGTILTLY